MALSRAHRQYGDGDSKYQYLALHRRRHLWLAGRDDFRGIML